MNTPAVRRESLLGSSAIMVNYIDLKGSGLFKIEMITYDGVIGEDAYCKELNKNVFGISHLVEHLKFKSPVGYTTTELMDKMKRYGSRNAYTSFNGVTYFHSGIMKHMEESIKMVVAVFTNTLKGVNQEEFEKERAIVCNELDMYRQQPAMMHSLRAFTSTYGLDDDHNILGDPKHVAEISLDDCIYVAASKALSKTEITITYDSSVEDMETIESMLYDYVAETTLEQNANETYPVKRLTMKLAPEDTVVNKVDGITNATITMIIDLSEFLTINPIIAGMVTNWIYEQAGAESLFQTIREKYGLTYRINMSFDASIETGQDVFKISMEVKPEDIDKAIKVLKEQLHILTVEMTGLDYDNLKDNFDIKTISSLSNLWNLSGQIELIKSLELRGMQWNSCMSSNPNKSYRNLIEKVLNKSGVNGMLDGINRNIDSSFIYITKPKEK